MHHLKAVEGRSLHSTQPFHSEHTVLETRFTLVPSSLPVACDTQFLLTLFEFKSSIFKIVSSGLLGITADPFTVTFSQA